MEAAAAAAALAATHGFLLLLLLLFLQFHIIIMMTTDRPTVLYQNCHFLFALSKYNVFAYTVQHLCV